MADLNDKDYEFLYSLKEEDITRDLLIELFCNTKNKDKRYSPQTKMIIRPKASIFNNKDNILTNVGRYITNMFLLYKLVDRVEYQNYVLDKSGVEKIGTELANKLIMDEIKEKEFIDFINKLHWYSFTLISGITVSPSMNLLKPHPDVNKRKQELFKKYSKELEAGDTIVAAAIEKELVELAESKLKDDPTFGVFASKADADMSNNYKMFNIMKGPAIDNHTGKFNVVKSNLDEGISVQDMAAMGDTVITGGSARALLTQQSGYETKKFNSAFQTIVLDEHGTDCKSSNTVTVLLSNFNFNLFLFKYIIENNKLKLLTPDIIKSYIGKTINMRTAMYCKNPDKICSICAGELMYKFNLKNIGLASTDLSSTFLNLSMKSFHNQTIKTKELDFTKFF